MRRPGMHEGAGLHYGPSAGPRLFRLGLGAEIGVSNTKLHAYGPMGLEGLTTQKFVLFGEGQLRE